MYSGHHFTLNEARMRPDISFWRAQPLYWASGFCRLLTPAHSSQTTESISSKKTQLTLNRGTRGNICILSRESYLSECMRRFPSLIRFNLWPCFLYKQRMESEGKCWSLYCQIKIYLWYWPFIKQGWPFTHHDSPSMFNKQPENSTRIFPRHWKKNNWDRFIFFTENLFIPLVVFYMLSSFQIF